jgi:hypothetical protein
MKTFYVCSYGGCGSKMLCSALAKYGNVQHIHSKKPPDKLQYIGRQKGGKAYVEWFNDMVVPDDELSDYYVIYIYRNPTHSIMSQFENPEHLKHIQSEPSITLNDVLTTGKDLYNIGEFYNNYTQPNEKRNYKIYCVKYEDIFDKQDELSKVLGVGNLHLVNTSKKKATNKNLENIYKDLMDIMNKNDFIMIH